MLVMPSSGPLFRPADYFARASKIASRGTIVFVGYALGTAVMFFAFVEVLLSRIDDPPAGFRSALQTEVVGFLPSIAFSLLLAWLVVALVMHFIGGMLSDGRFLDALGVAGWAYAPNLLAVPVHVLVFWWELRDASLDGSSAETLAADLQAVEAGSHAIALFLLELVVIGWSVVILARGIEETHDAEAMAAWGAAGVVGFGAAMLALFGLPSG